jgi:lysophospholipase L1-like esterase
MRILFCVSLVLITAAAGAYAQPAPAPSPAAITADQLARLERAENRLKDWPNFARYRDANAALAPPAKTEDRVVFLGDSITDSWKLNEYFPGRPYVNRGISGQTTPQMLVRFRPDVIALKPKVVVILAGTNDLAGNTGPMSLEDIQGNIASMAQLARANGIRVVIASVLPVNDYAKNKEGVPVIRSTARPPEKILALNKWIREYTAANKLIYLDYFSATVDEKGFLRAELAGDGLHPNPAGYRIMKPLVEKAIAAALKQKK